MRDSLLLLGLIKIWTIGKDISNRKTRCNYNVAAIVNLDICERNFELAKKLHWDLSRFIIDYCQKTECNIFIYQQTLFLMEKLEIIENVIYLPDK